MEPNQSLENVLKKINSLNHQLSAIKIDDKPITPDFGYGYLVECDVEMPNYGTREAARTGLREIYKSSEFREARKVAGR
ncbi:unnamed protein product, partial [marine sediment metagenome]